MRNLVAVTACLVSACATTAAQPPEAPPVGNDAGSPCRSGTTDGFVGQTATVDVGARMLAASGARTIRWVSHGMMVTREFNPTRLTVQLDPTNRIVSARCG